MQDRDSAIQTLTIKTALGVTQFPASAVTMLTSRVTGYLKVQTSIFVGEKEFALNMSMQEVRKRYLPHWREPVVISVDGKEE